MFGRVFFRICQMFNEVKKLIQWGEEMLILEIGKVVCQVDGIVIVIFGEILVMVNVIFVKV